MFVGIAIVSLISLISLQLFLIWFNERLLMIFFTFMTSLGMAIFFNWNNGKKNKKKGGERGGKERRRGREGNQ